MRFPFLLQIKYKLSSPRSYHVIVGGYRKLAAQITDGILFELYKQHHKDADNGNGSGEYAEFPFWQDLY